jgi:hypothetical protein
MARAVRLRAESLLGRMRREVLNWAYGSRIHEVRVINFPQIRLEEGERRSMRWAA